MLDERKSNLLKLIIENYIETAEPVGSKFLVEAAELDVSGATVRNEMRELETMGFLVQPHTSAGRIPTQKGYEYYVQSLMKVLEPKKKVQAALDEVIKKDSQTETQLKNLAKYISGLVGNAVIMAHGTDSVYYTGISYMLSQVEFRDYAHTVKMSSVFDHCEDCMGAMFSLTSGQAPVVLIGNHNPFGDTLGTVACRFSPNRLFSVVGPVRMDYSRTVGIVQYLANRLSYLS